VAVNFYEKTGGNLSQLPDIPEATAKAFTHDLLKGLGFDPAPSRLIEQMLANTAFRGALNFFDTYTQHGRKSNRHVEVMIRQMAQMFLSSWYRDLELTGKWPEGSS